MQVDCAGVSLLMTGSPHTSIALCDTPFQTPALRRGFFYVQDERYAARSTWMCGAIVSVMHGIYLGDRYIATRTVSGFTHVSAFPQLSSGGAGAGIVLPGHGTSTSL